MMKKMYLIFIVVMSISSVGAEQKLLSHDAIYQTITQFIHAKLVASVEYAVNIVPLDAQLQLAECSVALEAFSSSEKINAGRYSIGVRCKGEKKWTIYVSVLISVFKDVVILARPVQRGDIITDAMLSIERRDISSVREDFFTDISQVLNKQVVRSMMAGSVVSVRNIVEPVLIKKGDKVAIHSEKSGLSISMTGIALMDGAKGQRIRVKNESSSRIINATIIEAGLVVVD